MAAPFAHTDQSSDTIVTRSDILRSRDIIRDHFDNLLRMMDDIDGAGAACTGHSVGTVDLTCNALASAMQTAIGDADAIKLAYRQKMPKPLAHRLISARPASAKPFGRRVPDAALPLTVSPGALA
jgi:hypothetical protein